MSDQNNCIDSNKWKELPGADVDISQAGENIYEIHVKGQLDSRWSEWLEGLEMEHLDDGEMVLIGPIIDQAALVGVLNKLSRLNLAIRSVNEVKQKDGMEEN